MEAQDRILLTGLARMGYPVPQGATSLEVLDYDALVQIFTYFLKKVGETLPEVTKSGQAGQRYRIVTPLVEKARARGIVVDMSMMLNPSPNDVRAALQSLLAKSEFNKGDIAKTTLSHEEKVLRKRKEINFRALSQFVDDDWIHPQLISTAPQRFRRLGGPIATVTEEQDETLLETVQTQLRSSANLLGVVRENLAGKTKKQGPNQGKISLKQTKVFDLQRVVATNSIQFERYVSAASMVRPTDTNTAAEEAPKFNALTDFEQKKASRKTSSVNDQSLNETKDTIDPQEIEKQRVEAFRKKRKEEIDGLLEELETLKGNLPD